MKKVGVLIIIGIIFISSLIVYFSFIHKTNCENLECWDYKLEKCERAEFINEGKDTIWRYRVIRKEDNLCIVDAEILRVITGLKDRKGLEGKSMRCSMPLGVIEDPERDLSRCTGRLKEEMQTMIIKKLHEYIVDNLGEINEEILEQTI